MKTAKNTLARWFVNRLRTIMEHNDYGNDWLTAKICDNHGKWTPVDLILREYYNNGGGSAKGFLGISRAECYRCYDYVVNNQELLRKMDYYSAMGWNNFGIPLWDNYQLH